MPKKPKSTFATAMESASTKPAPATSSKTDHFGERMDAIGESQKVVRTVTREVDPGECQLWEHHNRDYSRLNEDNCEDLISSFIAQGRQEVPAIVRQLPTPKPGGPRYEIICGARRFWTVQWLRENNYPKFKYLVELRALTDEEAFRLSDLENLDRVDLSDYERAIDYAKALNLYYAGKQKDMAKRLNRSEAWLVRHLKLSELPVMIPNAYADWSDLKAHHASQLAPLLSSKVAGPKVLKKAAELQLLHQNDKATGKKAMAGSAVLKALKDAARSNTKTKPSGPIASYEAKGKGTVLSVTSKNQRAVTLQINIQSQASHKELLQAFEQAITEHVKE